MTAVIKSNQQRHNFDEPLWDSGSMQDDFIYETTNRLHDLLLFFK